MKSALKSALTALKRWAAYYRMRAIETNLADQMNAYPYVRDEDTRAAMHLAIRRASKELCRARAEYQQYLPPGARIVWEVA